MAFSESTKDLIWMFAGGRCQCTEHHGSLLSPHVGGQLCGNTFGRHGDWEAHHRIPQALGGSDLSSNGAAYCTRCHELHHGRLPWSAFTLPRFGESA